MLPPLGSFRTRTFLPKWSTRSILVVRAAHTQYPDLQKTIESLGRERLLGVVLNGVEQGTVQEYRPLLRPSTVIRRVFGATNFLGCCNPGNAS